MLTPTMGGHRRRFAATKASLALASLGAVLGGTVPGGAARANSVNAATAQGAAAGQVLAPLQLVATDTLRFGTIARPQTGGTMTISPYGAISTTGDMGQATGIVQPTPRGPAHFTVSGAAGQAYWIGGNYAVTISNGSATMRVSAFTTNVPYAIGTLNAQGRDDFYIGGTLTVSAGQATGAYSGTFPIIVTYY